MTYVLIFIGGGAGSVFRYALGRLIQSRTQSGFPYGTLAVNVLGCILVGVLAKHFLNMQTESLQKAALVVGFCGGFTTFSTFSYETTALMAGGKWLQAGAYVAASVVGCVLATAIAMNAFARSGV